MNGSPLDWSPFWTFTLAAYKKDGFPAACVFLQDRFNVDVDFLLFGLFAGANGRLLSAEEIDTLNVVSSPWRRNVIEPLRAVRTWLKSQRYVAADEVHELRSGVLAREIESNGHQQRLMEKAVTIHKGQADATKMANNLVACLHSAGMRAISDADVEALAILFRAILPDLATSSAIGHLNAAASGAATFRA